MKVALFTDTYDEVNGVANTYRYLTEYCVKEGIALHVYAHGKDEDSVQTRGSVQIRRYKSAIPVDIYFDMLFDLKVPRVRILERAKEERYDIVHTATPGSMGLNALLVARSGDAALVGSYHTALPEYVRQRVEKILERSQAPSKHSGERFESGTWGYMKWYYNHCRLVLAPSEYTRSEVGKKLKVPVRIFTRGIDTERFHPRFREAHEGVVVLYVGRVSIEKNLGILADIFKEGRNAKLVVVGDGPYLEEMRRRCPDAEFTGFLDGEGLSRAYASADVFAFPSTTDTFGNVVLEAMSSGLPVVVTDKMGPKEMVSDGENGFVTRSTEQFHEKLATLIADDGLRKTMGRSAREYALSRSWDAVFGKLFQDYAEMAGSD